MKSIIESIIGRKGSFNPCYEYAHLFNGDINGFFDFLASLRKSSDARNSGAYNAFFYGTGVKDDDTMVLILIRLESWIFLYIDEFEQHAIDMGIPRHNSRQVAIERLLDDIEDDDEFFERCDSLKRYIKSKSARYNLLCNFRIYLHLS
jgi:hypothetical protein